MPREYYLQVNTNHDGQHIERICAALGLDPEGRGNRVRAVLFALRYTSVHIQQGALSSSELEEAE